MAQFGIAKLFGQPEVKNSGNTTTNQQRNSSVEIEGNVAGDVNVVTGDTQIIIPPRPAPALQKNSSQIPLSDTPTQDLGTSKDKTLLGLKKHFQSLSPDSDSTLSPQHSKLNNSIKEKFHELELAGKKDSILRTTINYLSKPEDKDLVLRLMFSRKYEELSAMLKELQETSR